jgi:cell division protein FtsB
MARQRLKKSTASSERLITSGRIGMLLLLAAAVWVGSGFVSKMVVAYRLNSEVAQLQKQNQHLENLNRGYQSQLTALAQAGGKVEQQRLHNYIQPDEKVYVIAQPSPGPSPSPSPHASPAAAGATAQPGGFWHDFWGALTSAFH